MNAHDWVQILFYLAVLLAIALPLGAFIAQVLEGRRHALTPLLGGVERLCYRAAGVDPAREMGWKAYALAMLAFNAIGLVVVYAMQRLQGALVELRLAKGPKQGAAGARGRARGLGGPWRGRPSCRHLGLDQRCRHGRRSVAKCPAKRAKTSRLG